MVVGIKDTAKLAAISVVVCCAVLVCTLFLNYNIDIAGMKDEIPMGQAIVLYDAQVLTGKVTAIITGFSLALTAAVMLLFYIKNYVDSHGKELGILKALGYTNWAVAKHFWVFGISILTGSILGYFGATIYMPTFYEVQNREHFFPELLPEFHVTLMLCLILLPTLIFMLLSVLYAYFRMQCPVLHLLKDIREYKEKIRKKETKSAPFLQDLRANTLRSRKILVFFVGFSAFCFSAMTQMSMSMKTLASENFAGFMISIGLILAFMTLLLSLSGVVRANGKTIAMMKVFGYTRSQCSKALLGGYRPVSYVGFALGTVYQYVLLKLVVALVFAEYEAVPEFHFDFQAMLLSLAAFLIAYELVLYCYGRKIDRVSVREIMLE